MIHLNGNKLAAELRKDLTKQIDDWKQQGHTPPHLAIVLIGDNPASHTYVQYKQQACADVGIQTTLRKYNEIKAADLRNIISELSNNNQINGIIVQLPLPLHTNAHEIVRVIDPTKDVDGLHPYNYGNMAVNQPGHIPATPLGIRLLLAHYNISTQGKHCVIVGRSRIVGSPLSILLARDHAQGNATVTLCHSHTPNLEKITRQADLLITATGKPKLITANGVKEGAVVIDVGITRVPSPSRKDGYTLQGDVDFAQVAPRCSYITPVPGGVGPMTITALLLNTWRAAQQQVKRGTTVAEYST